jgi:hypothetical protein
VCTRYWGVFGLLAAAYVIGYAALLVSTHGLPYVLDNNESFSAFIQGRNLLNFPLVGSAGLPDEALGPSQAAHPYAYTHGGGLPRLYAAMLYVLGVHGVEAQIAVTTFAIGGTGLYLAYHFFARLGGVFYSAIACLILFSDFVLVVQWQVDIWRVWHVVLFFGTFVCAQQTGVRRTWRPWAAVGLGVALFYYELVFGAFVLVAASAYSCWIHRHRLRRAALFITLMGSGAAASVLALTLQRAAYLGWGDMLTDTYLTYFARLGTNGAASALDPIRAFFSSRHIAFWYQVIDPQPYDSLEAFGRGIFHYYLEVPSPLFSAMILSLGAGWLLGLRGSRHNVPPKSAGAANMAALLLAWVLFLLPVFSGDLALGKPPAETWPFLIWDGSPGALGMSVGFALVSTFGLARVATGRWTDFQRLPTQPLVATVLLLVGMAVLVRFQYRLYAQNDAPLWAGALTGWVPLWLAQLTVTVAALVGAALSLCGSSALLGRRQTPTLLVGFLASNILAYAVVYRLAAANLMSAYAERYMPLLVFALDALIALALYCACLIAVDAVKKIRYHTTPSTVGTLAVTGSLAALLGIAWIHTQLTYSAQLAPSQFTFLQTLARPPYAGSSFVINNYAAPVSTYSGEWAYYDPVIGGGVTRAGYLFARDSQTYLWFADRDVNAAYLRPQYFVCVLPETLASLAARLSAQGNPISRCSGLDLVRGAVERPDSFPHRLMARDETGRDAWAIIKLNPDYDLGPGQLGPPRAEGDLGLGRQWYPLETATGESFRWVDNDAEIAASAPLAAPAVLRVDVESGPGLGKQDFSLQVADERGQIVSSVPVSGRQVVHLQLPLEPGATANYRLHVDGGGRRLVGDPRVLNFRVYSIDWDKG